MRKLVFGIAVTLLIAGTAKGQDKLFTQYNASPMLYNPANAGLIDGDYRVTANFRRERYAADYDKYVKIGALSFDMPLLRNALPKGDALGFGVFGVTGKQGTIWGVANADIGVSLAYHKSIGRDKARMRHLSVGFQGVRTQFSEEYFDYGSHGIPYNYKIYKRQPYTELNMGINYTDKINDKVAVAGGYAIGHAYLHSFHKNLYDDYIQITHTLNVSANFDLSKRIVLNTNALCRMRYELKPESIINATAGYVFNPGKEQSTILYVGCAMHNKSNNRAVAPNIGLEYKNVRIGFSYNDISESDFDMIGSGNQGYELSLSVTGKAKKNPSNKWGVPRVY
jgi:type IX secretion system PorP/SprF family membrane protein